ncbi:MAG: Lrp/AsnC family transcriptional regulator [Candidatus Bathyarchaeota archaeon]|nr:Lrp/AsnC family transcriptional regulator [Candidatus Bathyarchaeota archaeon]MCX8177589.1 Lrp/AsnC family transcriptional regulator [Candidatus Bathyarchaeota archaeon]MDW8194297.1 Lrp/AsnC family transcriptional regulator [Nitrososphaerota archaeon]
MVDKTDLAVLRLLQEDASMPFTEIARRLGISESTVRKRVEKMICEGIIKKFTVVVDPSKIGLKTIAIVGVDVDPSRLLDVSQKLCEIPEVRYVATSTGDHMIMTEIWTRDGRELTRILSEKIGTIEGIKKICPAIVLEKLKE